MSKQPISNEENTKATILSIGSILLLLIPVGIMLAATGSVAILNKLNIELPLLVNIIGIISDITMELSPIAYITGLILVIYTRVKYPASVISKIAMWIYIIITAIGVAIAIITMLFLMWACNGCINYLGEMRKMR